MLLTEALQIPPSARCICAVGAGGKTSLLYELAEEYRQEGKRVLLTTARHENVPAGKRRRTGWNGKGN